jgi:hypothetical protein
MNGDSTITESDDERIGFGARVALAAGTTRISCFRLVRRELDLSTLWSW